MLLLGFTRSVASVFTGWNNSAVSASHSKNNHCSYISRTISLRFGLPFSQFMLQTSLSMQVRHTLGGHIYWPENLSSPCVTVQTSNRALLVDTLPSSEQAVGNAWTARMIGIGSVLGFFVCVSSTRATQNLSDLLFRGNMDLPEVMPFFGDSQLKVLSVVLSIILLSAHFLVCTCVKERVLLKNAGEKSSRKSIYAELRDIWVNMRTLPRVIRQIVRIFNFVP